MGEKSPQILSILPTHRVRWSRRSPGLPPAFQTEPQRARPNGQRYGAFGHRGRPTCPPPRFPRSGVAHFPPSSPICSLLFSCAWKRVRKYEAASGDIAANNHPLSSPSAPRSARTRRRPATGPGSTPASPRPTARTPTAYGPPLRHRGGATTTDAVLGPGTVGARGSLAIAAYPPVTPVRRPARGLSGGARPGRVAGARAPWPVPGAPRPPPPPGTTWARPRPGRATGGGVVRGTGRWGTRPRELLGK